LARGLVIQVLGNSDNPALLHGYIELTVQIIDRINDDPTGNYQIVQNLTSAFKKSL
jgi:hypothetical protein